MARCRTAFRTDSHHGQAATRNIHKSYSNAAVSSLSSSSSSSSDMFRRNNFILMYRNFSQSSDRIIERESKGEEYYELALEALRNAANAKQELEEMLMREQYEAMERQRQKTNNNHDRAAGVAVVRTIVNQTRQSNDVKVDKWDKSENNKESASDDIDEDYYQRVALQHLEIAALKCGHPLALLRLGNEALDRAKSFSPTDEPLINNNRCIEWLDESPIDLSSILSLSSKAIDDVKENSHAQSLYISLATILYEEAGKAGSSEAWFNLGHLLWDRSEDDKAKMKAMDAFHKAVDLGDADAMYFVAAQYLSSEEDHETGYQLLCRAGHELHGPSLHHLALLSLQKGKKDDFRVLLDKAVEADNPDSLFLQGHCYYNGEDGYEVDMKAALNNFLIAAENFGHVDAMVSAGAMLYQGGDQRRAFELYQQAGELGSIEGWRNVVSCYATGSGVKKDLAMAKHIANTMLKVDDS
jgi:TPR repeat protein